MPSVAERGSAVLLWCPRHMCPYMCVDMYMPSHVCSSPCVHWVGWGHGGCGSARASWRACSYVQRTRVSTCIHAQSWLLSPKLAPSLLHSCRLGGRRRVGLASALLPREAARPRWEAEARSERWVGVGAGVRASCPATGGNFGRKVGPIRKALPREGGFWRLSQLPPSSSWSTAAAFRSLP